MSEEIVKIKKEKKEVKKEKVVVEEPAPSYPYVKFFVPEFKERVGKGKPTVNSKYIYMKIVGDHMVDQINDYERFKGFVVVDYGNLKKFPIIKGVLEAKVQHAKNAKRA